jgi:hypothetical protein
MTARLVSISFGVALFLLAACTSMAAEIEAKPGDGTISAALAKAKPGDVVKLAAGDYRDSLKMPPGVTLLGAGPDKTKLTGSDFALVQIVGANVTIVGIEFRAGDKMERGVNSDFPVRVERCRFVKFPHGIALSGAPLSDVMACEFNECGIGVRAIGKASPTVWACRFEGGRQGVFVMDGGPYIRNNLFHNIDEGMRIMSENLPIVRNNVFWKCKTHGLLVMPRGKVALLGPSIRNNIFLECGDAVAGPAGWLSGLSHGVIFQSGDSPIHVEQGDPPFDLATQHIVLTDPALRLDDQGALTAKNSAVTKGQGIRLSHQPVGEKGDIGLAEGWNTPGCKTPAGLELPPARFVAPLYIANAVAEEYVAIESEGCKSGEQAMRVEDGRRLDILTVTCDGKEAERRFDIDRCFAEPGLKAE